MIFYVLSFLIVLVVLGAFLVLYDTLISEYKSGWGDVGIFMSSISAFTFVLLILLYPFTITENKLDDFIMVKTDQYVYFIKGEEVKISTEMKYAHTEKEHIDLYIVKRYNMFNKEIKTELKPVFKGDDDVANWN